ncbi:hypothetical protein G3M83_07130 [Rouxiella badensis]|uniref:hypothetical protein n=1 Tax=Rouxiella badensis TaxID=1646377 RepID=UPI0013EEFE37|nr:hypothetical protein [Rouxiella badensis]QII37485.1 hypothetical protein G3M83_07130 [Rouxiella badensis]
MKANKIDYSRFIEDEVIDDGGIEMAFRIRPTPVFYISRHGRFKKCLSRSAAINNLAHFMTQKVFDCAGIRTHEPGQKIIISGVLTEKRGELTYLYQSAHERTVKRIRKILAKQREIEKWKTKHDKLMSEYQALNKAKPF